MKTANERGMTMLFTVLILLLLTAMGLAAVNTASLETMIAGAEGNKRAAFYVAESGIEHAAGILRTLCVQRNQTILNLCRTTGQDCNVQWTFALDGSEAGIPAAKTAPGTGSSWLERYLSGALWIENRSMNNGYTYSVRVWNNNDGGGHTADTDGVIHVGAVASGPNHTRVAIEVVLEGLVNEESATATYTAQAGAGAGKNYNASDVNAITTNQLSGIGSISTP
jgi:Tfp pilus assembly protein PilX